MHCMVEIPRYSNGIPEGREESEFFDACFWQWTIRVIVMPLTPECFERRAWNLLQELSQRREVEAGEDTVAIENDSSKRNHPAPPPRRPIAQCSASRWLSNICSGHTAGVSQRRAVWTPRAWAVRAMIAKARQYRTNSPSRALSPSARVLRCAAEISTSSSNSHTMTCGSRRRRDSSMHFNNSAISVPRTTEGVRWNAMGHRELSDRCVSRRDVAGFLESVFMLKTNTPPLTISRDEIREMGSPGTAACDGDSANVTCVALFACKGNP